MSRDLQVHAKLSLDPPPKTSTIRKSHLKATASTTKHMNYASSQGSLTSFKQHPGIKSPTSSNKTSKNVRSYTNLAVHASLRNN